MTSSPIRVFFYGLFMDSSLLAREGVHATEATIGCLHDFSLRIGQRATLVPSPGDQAYGVLVSLPATEVDELYADSSVADYLPESVTVVREDGSAESAVCYNLPEHQLDGANPEYAEALLQLAHGLGFPDSYLEEIRKQR